MDRSIAYALMALKLSADKPGLRIQKVNALINWSYALMESGALDSAAIIADSARTAAVGVADSSARSALLVLNGYMSDFREHAEEALQFYFEGLTLCPDLKHKAAIYNNIGSVYKVINDLDNAEKYFKLSYSIGVQMGDSVRQGKCLNNLGGIFYSKKDYPGALRHYKQSLHMREALFDSVGISSSLSNIAMVYEDLDKGDSALLLYKRSLALGYLSGRPVDIIVPQINIGNLLFRMNKKSEAFNHLQMAASLSDSFHIHYYSRLAHRSLANYYAKTGNYEKAYNNYVLYAAYNDSVLTERSQKGAKELELRYRTRESAQQIKLLGEQHKASLLENENKENEIGRQRNLLWVIVLTTVAIILFAALLFQRYRAEKKYVVTLVQLVSEKDLLMREIHHRVKNNLQLVSSLLSLQDAQSSMNGKEALLRNQERIHTLALLHEQLYQSANLKAISFREYMRKLLDHISASYTKNNSAITINCEVSDRFFDIDQLVPYGLIVNELVTNCFKYAFPSGKGIVTVSMSLKEEDCVLKVADNGIGMSEEAMNTNKTLGLRLVSGLCRQLRGQLQVESRRGKGTIFSIVAPVKN
ncbi:MAG: tetratricopeptide repeat protein [Bacteroidota bacterium]|nr:tetratricopeptide repeat protein [Bacteroidota bacterium]